MAASRALFMGMGAVDEDLAWPVKIYERSLMQTLIWINSDAMCVNWLSESIKSQHLGITSFSG